MHRLPIRSLLVALAGAFVVALSPGCKSHGSAEKPQEQAAPTVELVTPTKEILVFDGDTNRSYAPLGSVEYTLPHGVEYGSTLDVPPDAQKELKQALKSIAFMKYGDKVDAIINVKMSKEVQGGFWGSMGAGLGAKNSKVSGEGVAVSFK